MTLPQPTPDRPQTSHAIGRLIKNTRPHVYFSGAFLVLFFNLLVTAGCSNPQSQTPQDNTTVTYLTPARADCPSEDGLKQYVFRNKGNDRDNHFSALMPHRAGQADEMIWLYWSEGQRIIYVSRGLSGSPVEQGRSLVIAKSLDLTRDVVETPEQINGSTYLVDRPRLERLLIQFKTQGLPLVIAPFSNLDTENNDR